MPRQARKNQKLAQRAAPIRGVLQKLVRRRVKTKPEREALAKFLNQEPSSVANMIYAGEGGLDSWIGALSYCYDLDPKAVEKSLEDFERFIRKSTPTSKTDKLYFELSEMLLEDDLLMLLSLIRASVKLTPKK